jgi:hypothetical protein
MATEKMLNQAAEAKKASEEIVRRMYGVSNGEDAALPSNGSETPQSLGTLRQLQVQLKVNYLSRAGSWSGSTAGD